jgi:hypothetical protein
MRNIRTDDGRGEVPSEDIVERALYKKDMQYLATTAMLSLHGYRTYDQVQLHELPGIRLIPEARNEHPGRVLRRELLCRVAADRRSEGGLDHARHQGRDGDEPDQAGHARDGCRDPVPPFIGEGM